MVLLGMDQEPRVDEPVERTAIAGDGSAQALLDPGAGGLVQAPGEVVGIDGAEKEDDPGVSGNRPERGDGLLAPA